MLNSSYNSLTDVWSSFTRAGGAAQRIMSLLDLEPAIEGDEGESVDTDSLKGDIELKEVEFSYQMRPEAKVLKGINLKIGSGQVCAFVGKSGGGKSTIISLLLRYYDPKSGRIELDGTDLTKLNPKSYRKNIGLVSQDTELFNTTIEENIAYGVESYTKKQLEKAAKQANAHDFITAFEDGYATRIGERGTRISGGQKQRIALARVFLRKPKILFLDEATSALDAESEALVQEAIDRLLATRSCTVVLVAHRLSTVINADQIAVINDGVIVEKGTHTDLLSQKGVYSKLVARQVSRMANTLEQHNVEQSGSAVDNIDSLIDSLTENGTSPSNKGKGEKSDSSFRGGRGGGSGRGGRGGGGRQG